MSERTNLVLISDQDGVSMLKRGVKRVWVRAITGDVLLNDNDVITLTNVGDNGSGKAEIKDRLKVKVDAVHLTIQVPGDRPEANRVVEMSVTLAEPVTYSTDTLVVAVTPDQMKQLSAGEVVTLRSGGIMATRSLTVPMDFYAAEFKQTPPRSESSGAPLPCRLLSILAVTPAGPGRINVTFKAERLST